MGELEALLGGLPACGTPPAKKTPRQVKRSANRVPFNLGPTDWPPKELISESFSGVRGGPRHVAGAIGGACGRRTAYGDEKVANRDT